MNTLIIIQKAEKAIKNSGGMADYSYWKGYCDCCDEINNHPKGSAWDIVKPQINRFCDKYRSNLHRLTIG